ncbi:MAG: hypothetical protein GXP22_10760 [Gammaproteobacteria bacterium]|nr:hypothetical protein [Gammaproteobacteria bacterium]
MKMYDAFFLVVALNVLFNFPEKWKFMAVAPIIVFFIGFLPVDPHFQSIIIILLTLILPNRLIPIALLMALAPFHTIYETLIYSIMWLVLNILIQKNLAVFSNKKDSLHWIIIGITYIIFQPLAYL